ncbi:TRAP transporter small permease [candidate division NPL-UPA2 bacterium]|nr:TRAP transporter small permease [candidate division NPL-UPA2 bacterium]
MKDNPENTQVCASELKVTLFDSVLLTVSSLMFASILLLVFLQVFVRLLAPVTGFILPWTEETARFLLILTTFLGAAVAMQKNEHIIISTIIDRVGPKTRLFMEIVSLLLTIVFIVLLGQGSYRMMQKTITAITGSIPWLRVGHLYAVMTVFMIFIGIYALRWFYVRVPEFINMLKSTQISSPDKQTRQKKSEG